MIAQRLINLDLSFCYDFEEIDTDSPRNIQVPSFQTKLMF